MENRILKVVSFVFMIMKSLTNAKAPCLHPFHLMRHSVNSFHRWNHPWIINSLHFHFELRLRDWTFKQTDQFGTINVRRCSTRKIVNLAMSCALEWICLNAFNDLCSNSSSVHHTSWMFVLSQFASSQERQTLSWFSNEDVFGKCRK